MTLEQKRAIGLAVLGVVVVASVAYISFSVALPKTTAAKTANQTSKDQAQSDKPTEDTAVASAAELSTEHPPLPRRDPFAFQPLPGAQLETAEASQPRRVTKRLKLDFSNMSSRLPAINVKPINPFVANNQSSPSDTQALNPEPEEELVVTGVVRGESNVAIVRIGATGRHVVREGQVIDGRYRVASINTDHVVFIYNNRPIAIKVGGNRNAAR